MRHRCASSDAHRHFPQQVTARLRFMQVEPRGKSHWSRSQGPPLSVRACYRDRRTVLCSRATAGHVEAVFRRRPPRFCAVPWPNSCDWRRKVAKIAVEDASAVGWPRSSFGPRSSCIFAERSTCGSVGVSHDDESDVYFVLQRTYRATCEADASTRERRKTTRTILSEFAVFMLLITRTNSGRLVQPLQPTAAQRSLLQRLGLSTPAQLLSHRLPRPPR